MSLGTLANHGLSIYRHIAHTNTHTTSTMAVRESSNMTNMGRGAYDTTGIPKPPPKPKPQ